MIIRKATLQDIPEMMELFAIARRFMEYVSTPIEITESCKQSLQKPVSVTAE